MIRAMLTKTAVRPKTLERMRISLRKVSQWWPGSGISWITAYSEVILHCFILRDGRRVLKGEKEKKKTSVQNEDEDACTN